MRIFARALKLLLIAWRIQLYGFIPLPSVRPPATLMCPSPCICSGTTLNTCNVKLQGDLIKLKGLNVEGVNIHICPVPQNTSALEINVTRLQVYCQYSKQLSTSVRASFPQLPYFLSLYNNTLCNVTLTKVGSDEPSCSFHTLHASSPPTLSNGASETALYTSSTETRRTKVRVTSPPLPITTETSLNSSTAAFTYTSPAYNASRIDASSEIYLSTNISTTEAELNATAVVPFRYRYISVLVSTSISGAALFFNFILLVHLCTCKELTLVRVFGMSLMLFNIVLATYGAVLTLYLYFHPDSWGIRFCQGLTSVKLFSLGSIVWALMMLTFHFSIRNSSEDERDAIFKGIVYVMEGMMLVGVFAVLSWIKLNNFDYLCAIFNPQTTVESLIVGIEAWHYFVLFMLIVRYPVYKIRKMRAEEKREPREHDQEHPILIIMVLTLVIWVGGYVYTYLSTLSMELRAVIRLNSLLVPLVLQPLLFAARNTCLCTCRAGKCWRRKKLKVEEDLLSCSCDDDETCSICEKTIQLTEIQSNQDEKEAKKEKKGRKRNRKDKTVTPVVVCRSPVDKSLPENQPVPAVAGCDIAINVIPHSPANIAKHLDSRSNPDGQDEQRGSGDASDEILDQPSPNHSETSPRHHRQSQVPSFIPLEDSDVNSTKASESPVRPSLIKPSYETKKDKTFDQTTNETDVEGRVSRGPTFYPIRRQQKKEEKRKKRQKKSDYTNTANDDDLLEAGEMDTLVVAEKDQSKKNKHSKRKSKSKSKGKDRKSLLKANDKRNSVDSLEWDPSYSGSGSSGCSPVDDGKPSQKENKSSDTSPCNNSGISETSFQEKSMLPPSDIRTGSADCEWEPYGVDEPNSGRASEAKNKLELLKKTSSEDSEHSLESANKPKFAENQETWQGDSVK